MFLHLIARSMQYATKPGIVRFSFHSFNVLDVAARKYVAVNGCCCSDLHQETKKYAAEYAKKYAAEYAVKI
jgi:hypothetical protein